MLLYILFLHQVTKTNDIGFACTGRLLTDFKKGVSQLFFYFFRVYLDIFY